MHNKSFGKILLINLHSRFRIIFPPVLACDWCRIFTIVTEAQGNLQQIDVYFTKMLSKCNYKACPKPISAKFNTILRAENITENLFY